MKLDELERLIQYKNEDDLLRISEEIGDKISWNNIIGIKDKLEDDLKEYIEEFMKN